jgi:hypothetical protein
MKDSYLTNKYTREVETSGLPYSALPNSVQKYQIRTIIKKQKSHD